MGRELRKVPANWQHPKNEKGNYIPLLGRSYSEELNDWNEQNNKWQEGLRSDFEGGWKAKEGDQIGMSFEQWHGKKPEAKDYMPEWTEEEKTHIQLYENTSEGTPLTPPFKADELEKLCEFAADNKASIFGNFTATKEQWMDMLKDDFPTITIGDTMII